MKQSWKLTLSLDFTTILVLHDHTGLWMAVDYYVAREVAFWFDLVTRA
jgi:hypothetical protein